MERRDRGLQREWTGRLAQRVFDERERFGDLRLIEAAPLLLVEQHEIAAVVGTRLAP